MVGLSKGTPTPPPPPTTTTEIRAGPIEVAQSPWDETSTASIVRKKLLTTVRSCRTRRKEMVPTNPKKIDGDGKASVVSSDNSGGEVLGFVCYMCFS
jgi:hypothetical protein